MKKSLAVLFCAVLFVASLSGPAFAEEKQEVPADPNATNLTVSYPVLDEAVPAMPVRP